MPHSFVSHKIGRNERRKKEKEIDTLLTNNTTANKYGQYLCSDSKLLKHALELKRKFYYETEGHRRVE